MARQASILLDTNDSFPTIDMPLISGQTIRLPDEIDREYAVILFYRGSW